MVSEERLQELAQEHANWLVAEMWAEAVVTGQINGIGVFDPCPFYGPSMAELLEEKRDG